MATLHAGSSQIHASCRHRQHAHSASVHLSWTRNPSNNVPCHYPLPEQQALKAVINLVDDSQLVDLHELLEHHVVEECVALFNSNGTYRKTQKSKLIQKFSLQPVDLQEPYIALIDMGMIWRMATPTAEDRQTQDGTPYKWSNYVQKVSSIIFARHNNATRIICANDPYDTTYSIKDDKRDLRVERVNFQYMTR